MSYTGIRYNQLKKCGNWKILWMICTNVSKIENHKYRVTKCIAKIRKIYTYIILKYINCGRNYQTTAVKCIAKLKA